MNRLVETKELDKYITDLDRQIFEKSGFWYVGVLRGRYLDEAVDMNRLSFNIPDGGPLESMANMITMDQIMRAVVVEVNEFLKDYLQPIATGKIQRITDYVTHRAPQFRHLLKYMPEAISKIKPNLSEDKLDDELHRIKRDFDRTTDEENTQLLDELNKGVISSSEYIQKFGLQIEKINSATGLGLKFSSMMLGVANNSMFLVLVMLMLASMLLGMGLPTTPAYLILAVLGAPTLITLGVDPLAAHMFVFYFGAISMITPPVAMAVYAACSIAKSKFWPTAGFAVLLGLPAFIVPYMFVYEPAMLFHGSNLLAIIALVTGVLGAIFYSAGINGYFVKRTKLIPSIILVAAGIMMITPQIWLSVAGVVIAGIVFIIQKIETKKDTVRLS